MEFRGALTWIKKKTCGISRSLGFWPCQIWILPNFWRQGFVLPRIKCKMQCLESLIKLSSNQQIITFSLTRQLGSCLKTFTWLFYNNCTTTTISNFRYWIKSTNKVAKFSIWSHLIDSGIIWFQFYNGFMPYQSGLFDLCFV